MRRFVGTLRAFLAETVKHPPTRLRHVGGLSEDRNTSKRCLDVLRLSSNVSRLGRVGLDIGATPFTKAGKASAGAIARMRFTRSWSPGIDTAGPSTTLIRQPRHPEKASPDADRSLQSRSKSVEVADRVLKAQLAQANDPRFKRGSSSAVTKTVPIAQGCDEPGEVH